eukprot:scaffold343_cov245-Pinguiococcus_pyrenoidosus.AAC.13
MHLRVDGQRVSRVRRRHLLLGGRGRHDRWRRPHGVEGHAHARACGHGHLHAHDGVGIANVGLPAPHAHRGLHPCRRGAHRRRRLLHGGGLRCHGRPRAGVLLLDGVLRGRVHGRRRRVGRRIRIARGVRISRVHRVGLGAVPAVSPQVRGRARVGHHAVGGPVHRGVHAAVALCADHGGRPRGCPGPGLVDPQVPPLELGVVRSLDGGHSLRAGLEGHEAESSGAPGLVLQREEDLQHVAEAAEILPQLLLHLVHVLGLLLGLRLVHAQQAVLEGLVVGALDGPEGVLPAGHGDEAKAAMSLRAGVQGQNHVADLSEALKVHSQRLRLAAVRQVAHEDLHAARGLRLGHPLAEVRLLLAAVLGALGLLHAQLGARLLRIARDLALVLRQRLGDVVRHVHAGVGHRGAVHDARAEGGRKRSAAESRRCKAPAGPRRRSRSFPALRSACAAQADAVGGDFRLPRGKFSPRRSECGAGALQGRLRAGSGLAPGVSSESSTAVGPQFFFGSRWPRRERQGEGRWPLPPRRRSAWTLDAKARRRRLGYR